jgi:drug/metabolite transporter (DMT)-like permease
MESVNHSPSMPPASPDKEKKASLKTILLLQAAVLIFSCSSLLMKVAAQYPALSWPWILLYGASILVLGVYALCWQQFLKHMPLTTAYANRAMTMFWSMVFGALLFSEHISWNMILGVAVMGVGIYFVVTGDEE